MESSNRPIVYPGTPLIPSSGFMQGHGTFISSMHLAEPFLVANSLGQVERVNRLVSVKPIRSKYIPDVGDLVVGSIMEVGSKRWKVDLHAHRNATLHLSSIILPDGAQRVRTYEDQLQMRSFYAEGDLICAEVQTVHHDGTPLLHTRSFKYGKLDNGLLVKVPPYLVPRQKQHFVSLPCGVDIVLALNGYLWLSRSIPTEWQEEEDERVGVSGEEMMASLQRLKERHKQTPTDREDRLVLIRVRNSILTLKMGEKQITPDHIMRIFSASLAEEKEPREMMHPEVMYTLLDHLERET